MDVFAGMTHERAWESLIKMGIGVVLGALIGFEREIKGHPAGIRTHMLMVLGVIAFSEVSKNFGGDPSRIAAQIVTGVGFLGAGTILRVGPEIRGLTTAASIWSATGIGMAVSAGGPFLTVALGATALTMFTLGVVDRIEDRFFKTHSRRVLRLKLENREALFQAIETIIESPGVHVSMVSILQTEPDLVVNLEIRGSSDDVDRLFAKPGVLEARWET